MLPITSVLVSSLLVIGVVAVRAATAEDATPPACAEAQAPAPETADATEAGSITRVGGDPIAEVEPFQRSGKTMYRAGKCIVDESLPVGYPRPTPPGAIELKHYPSVRRAEVHAEGTGDFKMMGRASSNAFWPLFKHIKRRDIPMTAPVEMDYQGLTAAGEPEGWTMSFLYRVPEMGDTGRDGEILIHDSPPLAVVSIGVKGRLNEAQMRTALRTLESWLAENRDWQAAGDPRTLGYNGPNIWPWNRWWEVQIPVEHVSKPHRFDDTPSAENPNLG